jgi:phosphocarrier protein HPr
MAQRSVTIASRVGLHARPAMIFVQTVSSLGVPVLIAKPGDEPVDASSILGVMALGARFGDEVVLAAEGASADTVLDELVSLLSRDLDSEQDAE